MIGLMIYLSGSLASYFLRRHGDRKIFGKYTKDMRNENFKISLFSWFAFLIMALILSLFNNEEEKEDTSQEANW